ncbi:MAG: flavodoxin family protein [Solirubrobacterales bacterium]
MKVLAINGSPHEQGNTAALLAALMEHFDQAGWAGETIHLNKLSYRGCQGCMACKTKTDHCVILDDATRIYCDILAADVILFGSPVYFFDVTGQFKQFFDRCYSFWGPNYKPRVPSGKTAVLVVPSGQDNAGLGHGVTERYGQFLRLFGFSEVESLVCPGLRGRPNAEKLGVFLERGRVLADKLIFGYAQPTRCE